MHPYVSVQAASNASDVASLEQAISTRWQQFESEFEALPPQMNVWITEYNFVDPTGQASGNPGLKSVCAHLCRLDNESAW